MNKNAIALSVLCALSVIGLYPEVVFATGMTIKELASSDKDIENNHLQLSGVTQQRVYSAVHEGKGNVINNSIVVSSTNYSKTNQVHAICGGFTNSGDADLNSATVDSTIDPTTTNITIHDVFGGYNQVGGSATENKVFVTGKVSSHMYGNDPYSEVAGGVVNTGSKDSRVYKNIATVNVSDGFIGTPNGGVYGGTIRGGIGTAEANSVELINGHVSKVIGGYVTSGSSTANTVLILGGLVAGQDKASAGELCGGYGTKANGNGVTISGGKVIGSIYGGHGETEASGNWIVVSDNKGSNPDLSEASLFGGYALISQNNTLSIETTGLVVQQIGYFQNLNFEVDQAVGSTPIVRVIGKQATDIRNSIVTVTLDKNAIPLQKGQEIILLENTKTIATDGLQVSIDSENLLDYGLSLKVTEKTLGVLVNNVETKLEVKSIASANLSRIAFVNQGSDLLVGQGIVAGREAAENGRHLFVALQTGSNHYNIDSYIDLEGESVLVGSVWPIDAFGSKVTLGGFIESGWGDYEVENALTAQSAIKGQGETHYRGAGLLAYWSESPLAEQGLYAEASMRLGRADISYQSVASSLDIDYDVKGTYWAGHVGLGYRHQFNDENHADLYTKFFYSHQDSDAFVINRNTVQMDTIESMRWRTGLSYCHRGFTPEGFVFDWQTSLAYEYEFDGKAEGSVDGYRIHESELEGSTGIGEVSITFMPSEDSGTRVRASIQGFVGAREGYIGQIRWTQVF